MPFLQINLRAPFAHRLFGGGEGYWLLQITLWPVNSLTAGRSRSGPRLCSFYRVQHTGTRDIAISRHGPIRMIQPSNCTAQAYPATSEISLCRRAHTSDAAGSASWRAADRGIRWEPRRLWVRTKGDVIALVAIRTYTSSAVLAARISLGHELLGSSTSRSGWPARLSCDRAQQGCRYRGRCKRADDNQ